MSTTTSTTATTTMRIGDLAQQTGASVRALRYYEEQGLLTPARTPSGQRLYEEHDVARVRLVRSLYAAGLNSATIATLLPCVDTPSAAITAATLDLMHQERERIDDQIAALVATRGHLEGMIESATAYAREQA